MRATCRYMLSSLSLGTFESRYCRLGSWTAGSASTSARVLAWGDVVHEDDGAEPEGVLGGGAPGSQW